MNNNNTYYGLDEIAMGAFGGVMCKECGESWLEELVPEICPRCGIRLATHAGEGLEANFSRAERVGKPVPAITCDRCGLRVPADWEFPECQRCKRLLKRNSEPKQSICTRLRKWFRCP